MVKKHPGESDLLYCGQYVPLLVSFCTGKTIRSSPVVLPIWHTSVSSRICPTIWARCLRKSASSISGSCCSRRMSGGVFLSRRWWGNDPKEKRQAEIDILAEQDKNTAIFGECKWTNEKVDLGVLETLIKRSELFSYKNVHYYLFAKTGFTKGCVERADEMENVMLVSYKDMLL